ncbi:MULTISPECIES: single-stranded DNA-binding protein [Streptomyces]|uniref:Single-stranded DNA-binding protein n=1 Tax=Streptomyces cacaoi TaxID=1898 RepID=A0A4Y3QZX4_STRCI|nr:MULTISPECIES: single-stranded DNA-binding protein [Streptomyces]NNG84155.1 single-stranded DNA-binding protein [Streptomyces cacaoi]GEB50965.1 hypothetical protein SCA03_35160 [Streptomyces cacaoi]
MYETRVTVNGRVATQVDHWTAPSGAPVSRFRLASTVRRLDRQSGSWTDAFTSFYTVWAWRALAVNIASSLALGEPVLVSGRLRIREGEREGRRFVTAELTAETVGHDLSRGTAAFLRSSGAKPGLVPVPGADIDEEPPEPDAGAPPGRAAAAPAGGQANGARADGAPAQESPAWSAHTAEGGIPFPATAP